MVSASDAEEFYNHQRSIGTIWGVTLRPWFELSWEEQQEWEERLNEQISRDKENDHPR